MVAAHFIVIFQYRVNQFFPTVRRIFFSKSGLCAYQTKVSFIFSGECMRLASIGQETLIKMHFGLYLQI